MGKQRTVLALALLCALIIMALPIFGAFAVKPPKPDPPQEWTLIWEADVLSKGVPVTSPMLLDFGREYRIVAEGAFLSQDGNTWLFNHAADAQYYTPYPPYPDWWIWDVGNTFPAPDGHSFLQIDGMDVNWGQFSNGYFGPWGEFMGHNYTASYEGLGAPISFAIADWIDGLEVWGYYLNTCRIHVKIYEGTPVPIGQTAFAYGGDYATCFLCLDLKGNAWGWTNGPLAGDPVYTFDIWAGAAKCNLTKGTLVGNLTIDYDGSTAIVTYMMHEGWTMGFAQLYVGSEMLPRDGGDFTVSPGQYGNIAYVDGATHTFTVTGLSGDIYVIAHADVFEV